jgi:hypothetical protein
MVKEDGRRLDIIENAEHGDAGVDEPVVVERDAA